jgi:hypothetical protein
VCELNSYLIKAEFFIICFGLRPTVEREESGGALLQSRAQRSPVGNEILEKWSAAERRFHYKSLRARGAASLARARALKSWCTPRESFPLSSALIFPLATHAR